jgi:hypothetical protein
MTLADRIKEAMEYAEMTRADLARATMRTGPPSAGFFSSALRYFPSVLKYFVYSA